MPSKCLIGSQSVSKDILHIVMVEVEYIPNAKPLGYTSSDLANPDPVTPNMLLMGQRDASLPQVAYALQSRHKWQKPTDNVKLDSVVLI